MSNGKGWDSTISRVQDSEMMAVREETNSTDHLGDNYNNIARKGDETLAIQWVLRRQNLDLSGNGRMRKGKQSNMTLNQSATICGLEKKAYT